MKKYDQEARRLCRHTIVFTDAVDIGAAVMAMQGMTTKAIARELGITMAQAQYRISKAQNSVNTKFRSDYRSGEGELAQQMRRVTDPIALRVVRKTIAPKFIPLARAGVGRINQ